MGNVDERLVVYVQKDIVAGFSKEKKRSDLLLLSGHNLRIIGVLKNLFRFSALRLFEDPFPQSSFYLDAVSAVLRVHLSIKVQGEIRKSGKPCFDPATSTLYSIHYIALHYTKITFTLHSLDM